MTMSKGRCQTHCGKRRKIWIPAFSPFLSVFFTLPPKKFESFKSHLSCLKGRAYSCHFVCQSICPFEAISPQPLDRI